MMPVYRVSVYADPSPHPPLRTWVRASDVGEAIDLAQRRFATELGGRMPRSVIAVNLTHGAFHVAPHGATGNLDAESFDPPSANAIQVAGRQFSGGAA